MGIADSILRDKLEGLILQCLMDRDGIMLTVETQGVIV